ncbi:hypothetical protein NP233_g7515 [Leucocoprinus birnbaumii]|uniref:Uncharacterized protein n=1 Tax=Leucocoprinus birnbaumii TaxID=56174 RepID=A0AAD5VP55_9AGAR|nr:hypothetical protein NP233_g7515 [Leucocoprinus birnbaumii]
MVLNALVCTGINVIRYNGRSSSSARSLASKVLAIGIQDHGHRIRNLLGQEPFWAFYQRIVDILRQCLTVTPAPLLEFWHAFTDRPEPTIKAGTLGIGLDKPFGDNDMAGALDFVRDTRRTAEQITIADFKDTVNAIEKAVFGFAGFGHNNGTQTVGEGYDGPYLVHPVVRAYNNLRLELATMAIFKLGQSRQDYSYMGGPPPGPEDIEKFMAEAEEPLELDKRASMSHAAAQKHFPFLKVENVERFYQDVNAPTVHTQGREVNMGMPGLLGFKTQTKREKQKSTRQPLESQQSLGNVLVPSTSQQEPDSLPPSPENDEDVSMMQNSSLPPTLPASQTDDADQDEAAANPHFTTKRPAPSDLAHNTTKRSKTDHP